MKNVKNEMYYGVLEPKLIEDEMPKSHVYTAVHLLDPLRRYVRVKEHVWESLEGGR